MLGQRSLKLLGLALMGSLGAFAVQCGGDDASNNPGTGGSSGASGSTGTGGGATGGGGAHDASAGAGGGSARDVALDAYPASCSDPPTALCTAAAMLNGPVWSHFDAPEAGIPAAGCDGTSFISFGAYGDQLYGGTYVYPTSCTDTCVLSSAPSATPLSQDLSMGNWHITGTVGNYSGFGLYINQRTAPVDPMTGTAPYTGIPYHFIDASAYSGLKFTISGNAGPSGSVTAVMQSRATTGPTASTVNDLFPSPGRVNSTCGTCPPPATACGNLEVAVPVTATPTPVTITWAQAGIPDPAAFMSISWRFLFTAGTTYPVDLVVDDIEFVP